MPIGVREVTDRAHIGCSGHGNSCLLRFRCWLFQDLAGTRRIQLLDLLALHILPFMEDPNHFDQLVTWVPEKQHVR